MRRAMGVSPRRIREKKILTGEFWQTVMKAPYQPYAIARFDGSIMFRDYKIGVTLLTDRQQSLVILFKILAGQQEHPLYALDELAIRVYSYCVTASERNLRSTQLEASVTATPLSNDRSTTLVLTHIEWHTDIETRSHAEALWSKLRTSNGIPAIWTQEKIILPVRE